MALSEVALLATEGLVLADGCPKADIQVGEGLTLLHSERESSSTMWAMTLAGRMKRKSGQILLGGQPVTAPQLHKAVALAGVPQLDSLERYVSVASIVREQVVWTSPWYKSVPKNVADIKQFMDAAELIGLDLDFENASRFNAGSLAVSERFKLRVVLALVSRPASNLLIIDDIDQLRSFQLRASMLHCLAEVAQTVSVLVVSANEDDAGACDAVISEDEPVTEGSGRNESVSRR